MNPFNIYYINTFKRRYMQFRGRASRSEFWYFALFNFIIAIILSVLDATLGLYYTYEVAVNIPTMDGMQAAESTVTQTIGYLSTSYGIAVFLPSLSLTFRRLHDIGKSAWWLFIVLVPILGIFILFYFYIKASQPRNNRYGSIPGDVQSLSPIKDKSKTQKTIQIVGIVLIVLAASVGLFFFFVGGAVTGLSLAIFDSIGESTNQKAIEEKLIDLQDVTPANGGADIDLGTVCRAASCAGDGSTDSNTGITSDYTLPDNVTDPSVDLDAYGKVGKMSFGDIDFDRSAL